MSSWAYKTSHEPPVRDRRKVDKDPAKVPPHKKPRTYVLQRTVTTVTVRKTVDKYVSKSARDQARKDYEKKTQERASRWANWDRGNESSKQTLTIEYVESEES